LVKAKIHHTSFLVACKSVTSWRGQKSVVSAVSCRFPKSTTTTCHNAQLLREPAWHIEYIQWNVIQQKALDPHVTDHADSSAEHSRSRYSLSVIEFGGVNVNYHRLQCNSLVTEICSATKWMLLLDLTTR